jgi:hypothetical protein
MLISYKGFGISPGALHLSDSDEWEALVTITKYIDGTYQDIPYTDDKTFGSREEAENRAIDIGKHIIDTGLN